MKTKQTVYEIWREVTGEMGERYSQDAIKHQQNVLSFADMRETWSPLTLHRVGEHWLEKSMRVLSRPVTVAVFAVVLYFGCHVEWFAAGVLAVFGEVILRKLRHILWYVFRCLEVLVYMLARLNAEKERQDIYEARRHIEYMLHPEIPFEKELLDRDLYGFGYQVSDECLQGRCKECKGTCSRLGNGEEKHQCLHKCHKSAGGPS